MTTNLLINLLLVFIPSINLSHAQLHISDRRFSPLNETFEREREEIREEWRERHGITAESKVLKSYHEFLLTQASAANKEHLLNFNNPITLEPFSSLSDFLEYLKEYKSHLLGTEGEARAFFEKLEDWLITIETYQRAGVDPWMASDKGEVPVVSLAPAGGAGGPPPATVSSTNKISALELDPEGFKVEMGQHNFSSMLEVLN